MSKILKSIESVKSSIINDSFALVYDKKIYESTNEYFQLIQEIIQKYNSQKIKPKNSDGQNVSFPQNIDYKILILKFIAFEYEKGNIWVKELYEKILDQNFPSDEYFLHLFNINEFEVRTKPQCFRNLQKNKKNYVPQSKIFTFDAIDSTGKEDPLVQYAFYKQNIYKYVQIIRDQLELVINPINYILRNYRLCITKYLINKRDELVDIRLNNSNEIFEEQCNKVCNDIFEQINNFIYNITNCLILLYSKINNYQIFFEEFDEFVALMVSLLFEPGDKKNKYNDINVIEDRDDFYKVTLDLVKLKNIQKTEKMKKIIKSYKGIEPEDFGVPDKYCLTEKSVNYYIQCFKKNFEGDIPEIAYEKSIKMLKDIYKYKSPIDKLLLTTKLRKSIKDEINEFWRQLPEDELNKKELRIEIEIDDYINIFEYMIVKAGMNELIAHIDFVEIFTNDKIRKDFDDYNLQQIKVGIMQISDFEEKKDINIKNK
jgi:hypothetical protein